MEFFLLLITNVFIGAVLYLVISLKLEKKSSEFREQKFRKEMDEVIKEFNATAERNISLLENKIAVMKRLSERTGALKSLDITIDDKKDTLQQPAKTKKDKMDYSASTGQSFSASKVKVPVAEDRGSPAIHKGLQSLTGKIRAFADAIVDTFLTKKRDIPGDSVDRDALIAEYRSYENIIIEKDFREIRGDQKDEVDELLSEDDIVDLVNASDDKYSLISELSKKGCSVENISHYSGIPIGEVKLVLNLHKSS